MSTPLPPTPQGGSVSATYEPAQPTRGRSWVWPAVAVTFAVLSAVLGFLLFRAQTAQELTTSPDAAIALACDILGEVDSSATDLGEDEGFVALNQLGAVTSLSWVAFAYDGSYEQERDSLSGPAQAAQRNFSLEGEDVADALADAQATCADQDD